MAGITTFPLAVERPTSGLPVSSPRVLAARVDGPLVVIDDERDDEVIDLVALEASMAYLARLA